MGLLRRWGEWYNPFREKLDWAFRRDPVPDTKERDPYDMLLRELSKTSDKLSKKRVDATVSWAYELVRNFLARADSNTYDMDSADFWRFRLHTWDKYHVIITEFKGGSISVMDFMEKIRDLIKQSYLILWPEKEPGWMDYR